MQNYTMQNTMSEILLPLIAVYDFRFTKGRYENLTKIDKVVYPFTVKDPIWYSLYMYISLYPRLLSFLLFWQRHRIDMVKHLTYLGRENDGRHLDV